MLQGGDLRIYFVCARNMIFVVARIPLILYDDDGDAEGCHGNGLCYDIH